MYSTYLLINTLTGRRYGRSEHWSHLSALQYIQDRHLPVYVEPLEVEMI